MPSFARVQRPAAVRRGPMPRARSADDHEQQQSRVAPQPRFSFANVPVTGTTALNTENEQGPVGQGTPSPSPPTQAPPAPAPVPAPATPAPEPAPAPAPEPTPTPAPAAPAGPTIASATDKAAPDGTANTRKKVGVGEVIVFTGSAAGTWTASAGTATGASATTFRWTAPAVAGNVTITLKIGTTTATDSIDVIRPNEISMTNAGSHTAQVGAGGACMLTEVTIKPLDVNFGRTQWLEVPGPGTGISGFFEKFSAATLQHNPNTFYALIDDNNKMEAGPHNAANDHCAWHTTPGPYKDGAFQWVIPNYYIIDGEAVSAGRYMCDTTQRFTMDAAGAMTITKAGATT